MTATASALRRRTRWAIEGLVVVALAGTAIWYGRFAFLNPTQPYSFYVSSFGPAVMVATGHGFENPVVEDGTAFANFLANRANTLDARDAVPVRLVSPDQFQYAHRYLLTAVGSWWRVAGISWSGVAGVAAALHVLAVLGTYVLLRLVVPLLPSLLGALWMCTSTLQLSYVAQVRDYSKGAFILVAMPLVVMMAIRARSRSALLATAAATGVVIGVGIGFKMDVAVMAPIVVVCVVLFRGRWPWTDLAEKAQALAVFVLALLIATAPVLLKLSSGGSNAIHVILLGYADPFNTNLGIEPPVYGFLPFYNDGYVAAAIRTHGEASASRVLPIPSPEYDEASRGLWFAILRHFPADVFARGLAAADSILNLVFVNPEPSPFLSHPLPAQDTFIKAYVWLNRWNTWGIALGALLVVVVSLASVREGLLAGFLVVALAGYPSVQFDVRHYFHLQVIPLLALLVLAWVVLAAPFRIGLAVRAWSRGEDPGHRAWLRRVPVRLVAGVATVALLTAVPLGLLRAYQSNHVGRVLSRYLDGDRTRVDPELVDEGHNRWFVRWPGAAGEETARGQLSAYYVAEFRAEGPPVPMAIGLRYRSTSKLNDFSRALSVYSGVGVARFGFAVFGVPGDWEFEGIEVGRGLMGRLTGIYSMKKGPAGLPLELKLPAAWPSRPLYQQLAVERRLGRALPERQLVAMAGNASSAEEFAGLDLFLADGLSPDPGLVDITYAKTLTVTSTGITMDGIADTPASYLVQFKPTTLGAGAALVAQGRLEQGGLAIGLLKDNAWYGQVVVQQPGAFAVVVPITAAGTYVPMVTNAMKQGDQRNRFVITRFGLADTEAPANVPAPPDTRKPGVRR